MTETLLMLYTMFAAAGTFALLSLLGAKDAAALNKGSRDLQSLLAGGYQLANGIWLNQAFTSEVQPAFLKANDTYFHAGVERIAFNNDAIPGINGWVGFVMHFVASGAMVLLVGILYDRKPSLTGMTVGMALGSLARTLVMIPLNLILTVHAFGVPHDVVMSLMLPGIIPMNLIIAVTNCILAGLLFKALAPFLQKNRYLTQGK